MEVDRNGLEVLDRAECLRLLGTASLGRIGLTSGALPTVLPVNFRLIDDEIRLTTWMHTPLRISWCLHPNPVDVEAAVIEQWAPPLNVAHTTAGPVLDVITAARAAYNASA